MPTTNFYIALYRVLLYTQSALQLYGGGGSPQPPLGWCDGSQDNGARAVTTHQLQVERRESHWANQVDGDY